MAISDILAIAETIIIGLNKLAFIILCFYFGSIAFKGWKGRSNFIFKISSMILMGLLCFIGGLTFKTIFGLDFFLIDYLFSIFTAIILYFILRLISTAFKIKEKYSLVTDTALLAEEVKSLKIQVAKLTKSLEDRKIMPEALNEESVRKALAKDLERSGLKKYEIRSCTMGGDVWTCLVSSKHGEEYITVDSYTGGITDRVKKYSFATFVMQNPVSVIGVVLLIVFVIYLLSKTSISTIDAVDQAFDFSFLLPPSIPEGCVSARSTIENYDSLRTNIAANDTLIASVLPATQYLVPGMTRSVTVNSETYYLTTSYSSQVSSLGAVLSPSTLDNIYNVRVCVVKSDYFLCECVGGKQTDPVITVPYLVKLGVVEQAIQEAILGSLGRLFQ